MITRKRFIVDLLDDDNNNETEQFIRKYGADEITGMTNGDAIMALFPQGKPEKDAHITLFRVDGQCICFFTDWWGARYMSEDISEEAVG